MPEKKQIKTVRDLIEQLEKLDPATQISATRSLTGNCSCFPMPCLPGPFGCLWCGGSC